MATTKPKKVFGFKNPPLDFYATVDGSLRADPFERIVRLAHFESLSGFNEDAHVRKVNIHSEMVDWGYEIFLEGEMTPEQNEKEVLLNEIFLAFNQWICFHHVFGSEFISVKDPVDALTMFKERRINPAALDAAGMKALQEWANAQQKLMAYVDGQSLKFEPEMLDWGVDRWKKWWLGVPLPRLIQSFQGWPTEGLEKIPLMELGKKIFVHIENELSVNLKKCLIQKDVESMQSLLEDQKVALSQPLVRKMLGDLESGMPSTLVGRWRGFDFKNRVLFFDQMKQTFKMKDFKAIQLKGSPLSEQVNQSIQEWSSWVQKNNDPEDPLNHFFVINGLGFGRNGHQQGPTKDQWEKAKEDFGSNFVMCSNDFVYQNVLLEKRLEMFLLGLNRNKKHLDRHHWMHSLGFIHWNASLMAACGEMGDALLRHDQSTKPLSPLSCFDMLKETYDVLCPEQPMVSLAMNPGFVYDKGLSKNNLIQLNGNEIVNSFKTWVGMAQYAHPNEFTKDQKIKLPKKFEEIIDIQKWWALMGVDVKRFKDGLDQMHAWTQLDLMKKIEKYEKSCGHFFNEKEAMKENHISNHCKLTLNAFQRTFHEVSPVGFWKTRYLESAFSEQTNLMDGLTAEVVDAAIHALNLHRKLDFRKMPQKELKKGFLECSKEDQLLYLKWVWAVLDFHDLHVSIPEKNTSPWSAVSELVSKLEALVDGLDPTIIGAFYTGAAFRFKVPVSVFKKWTQYCPHWPQTKNQWTTDDLIDVMSDERLRLNKELSPQGKMAQLSSQLMSHLHVLDTPQLRRSGLFGLIKGRQEDLLGEWLMLASQCRDDLKWGIPFNLQEFRKEQQKIFDQISPSKTILDTLSEKQRAQVQQAILDSSLDVHGTSVVEEGVGISNKPKPRQRL